MTNGSTQQQQQQQLLQQHHSLCIRIPSSTGFLRELPGEGVGHGEVICVLGVGVSSGFGSSASSVGSKAVWGERDDARSVRGSAVNLQAASC